MISMRRKLSCARGRPGTSFLKYLLRQAAKPVITDTVYRRQKHPFLSPPVTTVPTERFHEMLQETLRGAVLASVPFCRPRAHIRRHL